MWHSAGHYYLQRVYLGTAADNINVNPQTGDLWLGGHPLAWKVLPYLEDPRLVSPSQVRQETIDPGVQLVLHTPICRFSKHEIYWLCSLSIVTHPLSQYSETCHLRNRGSLAIKDSCSSPDDYPAHGNAPGK